MATDKDEAHRLAASAQLAKVDPKQLGASIASAQALTARLPRDLHWSEEMAIAFRLPTPRNAKQ
jgi:hypothetical protein